MNVSDGLHQVYTKRNNFLLSVKLLVILIQIVCFRTFITRAHFTCMQQSLPLVSSY